MRCDFSRPKFILHESRFGLDIFLGCVILVLGTGQELQAVYSFKDFNRDASTIMDDEIFQPTGYFRTTGLPEGFSEVPQGHFVWMVVARGRIEFISAGMDPWEIAERLRLKYKADRVLYRRSTPDAAPALVAELIAKYQPPHNFKSQSLQLAELDAILESAE